MEHDHKVPILMYHDIELNDPRYDRTDVEVRPFVLPASRFEEQMRSLTEQRYHVISLEDFVFSVKEGRPLPEKSVIITFDDGHISNYLKAYPILKKYGLKAVFFIVTGFVGKPGMLTWEQIREMADDGMEIGSHTVTHSPPAKLTRDELIYELKESKRILEERLGREVKWVSSPTGYYNKAIETIARDVGYQAVCIGKFGANGVNCDLFSLKRIAIRRSYGFSIFKSLIELQPTTIYLYKTTDIFRTTFRRLLGIKVYGAIRKMLLKTSVSLLV